MFRHRKNKASNNKYLFQTIMEAGRKLLDARDLRVCFLSKPPPCRGVLLNARGEDPLKNPGKVYLTPDRIPKPVEAVDRRGLLEIDSGGSLSFNDLPFGARLAIRITLHSTCSGRRPRRGERKGGGWRVAGRVW